MFLRWLFDLGGCTNVTMLEMVLENVIIAQSQLLWNVYDLSWWSEFLTTVKCRNIAMR